MPTPILSTKLYIPPPRSNAVPRPRLTERLNSGLRSKLTLVSAAAGSGKTTLVGAWAAACGRPVAWLSLGEDDSDPTRFLTYIVAALQTIDAQIGSGVLAALQSPQSPPPDAILTVLLNEIAANHGEMVLVLDDYHTIESQQVDQTLAFLVEHLPPQMHLVISTREDPPLPLARMRVRGQVNEVRAADLRFTHVEAANFLNEAMGLKLSEADIAALERRTEGWIAGLQLAALSMQGLDEPGRFIESFTGNHHFVLDYLLEEVLNRQPEHLQHFLLQTSILDRLCGPLCDALISAPSGTGQTALEQLEQANLFIVPLDSERRWYRYHHLFGDLLRQRLHQTTDAAALHLRASQWYENNDLDLEAFQHAAAAHDIDHATRLVLGDEMPLFFRGGAAPVLHWLESLPEPERDVRPALRVMHASALLFNSSVIGVEENLRAAERALEHAVPDDRVRNLIGHIALIRATVAVSKRDAETIVTQSQRALAYLHPDNLPLRTATMWTLGVAKFMQGDRDAAEQALREALARSKAIGHFIIIILSSISLANAVYADNRPDQARELYQYALKRAGEPPSPVLCEAHLGLARIAYQQNDLDAAQHHAEESVRLGRQIAHTDWHTGGEIMLARIQVARGNAAGALAMLSEAEQRVKLQGFTYWLPMIEAAQAEAQTQARRPARVDQPLIEPLSLRELEILRLIDQGLSNSQIGERLYLALSTVKGHNQSIFGKLQVRRRTEALTRARELGLL